MSAFVVSKKHIDALLTFAMRPQYNTPSYYIQESKNTDEYKQVNFQDHLNEIGQKLVDQNYASVNCRYNTSEVPPVYKFEHYHRILRAVEAIKACDCWNYQSCENRGHEDTEAWEIVDTIRERAIDELTGYDSAMWEIVQ